MGSSIPPNGATRLTSYLIVSGNPIDGLVHHGPFETSRDAIAWADATIDDDEWWIARLSSPSLIARGKETAQRLTTPASS